MLPGFIFATVSMRVAVRYLLSLCVLLIASSGYTYSHEQHPADPVSHTSLKASGFFHQRVVLISKNTPGGNTDEYLTCDESEDGDFVFARRHTLWAKNFAVPLYSIAAVHFGFRVNHRAELYKYLTYTPSCKYLTHRVLKI